jgi:lipopolysaccharide biosynthesis glycosyltransferase
MTSSASRSMGSATHCPDASEVDVAFGFDASYAPHCAAVISSIIRHAPQGKFRFIILHDGIDPSIQNKFERHFDQSRFVWIRIEADDLPQFVDGGHFSHFGPAINFRLALETHAPKDCHRLIYLDVDLIVLEDLRKLWRFDLNGASIGAACDSFVGGDDFAQTWGLARGPDYFNSGVLLIDLVKVRSEKSFTRAMQLYAVHSDVMKYPDQDCLNHIFWGQWSNIGPSWNAQRRMLIRGLVDEVPTKKRLNGERPAIVHYTGAEKPWKLGHYHPWAWHYWRSLARTPFLDEVAIRHDVRLVDRFKLWTRWIRRWPR